jgi:sulfatase maturation enzyme AslB (radical SAM superfamily)
LTFSGKRVIIFLNDMSSIYLQLTTKCNMRCAHCCFSCNGKGDFMSREVFEKCLGLVKDYQWSVTIGGGEPTLHPNIIEWAMDAALASLDASMEMDSPAVLVVTNGKKADTAIRLAKLAHLGVIAAEVSQDPWHEAIDASVISEFTRYRKPNYELLGGHERGKGYAGVRDVSRGVVGAGRAKKNNIYKRTACCCDALFITPNGDFYHCGCKKTRLGNILTDAIPQHNLQYIGECENNIDLFAD